MSELSPIVYFVLFVVVVLIGLCCMAGFYGKSGGK
jgi:hypothetical protein